MGRARDWGTTAWVGPLALTVHLLGVNPSLAGAWSDDAVYLDMAESLARGEGLRVSSLPLGPETAKYPPGWPFVLSLLIRAGADPRTEAGLALLHACSALAWAVAAQITASVLVPRLGGGRSAQILVGLLLAVNTATMKLVPNGLSEGMFTAALVGAVALALRPDPGPRAAGVFGVAVLTAFAGLLRSVGAPLALLGVAVACAARRWTTAAGLLVGFAVQALVVRGVRAGIAPLSDDARRVLHYYVSYDEHVAYYTGPLSAADVTTFTARLAGTLKLNASLALDSLGALLYPGRFLGVDAPGAGLSVSAVLGGLLVGACFGAAVRAPAARAVLALIVGYAAIFLAWTWPFASRFWLPVFPLVVASATCALFAWGNVPRMLAWPLAGMLVVANAFSPAYRAEALLGPPRVDAPPERTESAARADALRTFVGPEDVLLGPLSVAVLGREVGCRAMEVEALLPSEDRLGILLGQTSPVAEADRLAAEMGASLDALLRVLPAGANAWVIVDPSLASTGQARTAPILAVLERQGRLVPAWESASARVWRVAPAAR